MSTSPVHTLSRQAALRAMFARLKLQIPHQAALRWRRRATGRARHEPRSLLGARSSAAHGIPHRLAPQL
jgi:anti-sigma factor RsiW